MSRVTELEAELSRAKARIAELEKTNAQRPLTIRQMKAEIAQAIDAQFTGAFTTTVSRDDLLKIHAWIMGKKS